MMSRGPLGIAELHAIVIAFLQAAEQGRWRRVSRFCNASFRYAFVRQLTDQRDAEAPPISFAPAAVVFDTHGRLPEAFPQIVAQLLDGTLPEDALCVAPIRSLALVDHAVVFIAFDAAGSLDFPGANLKVPHSSTIHLYDWVIRPSDDETLNELQQLVNCTRRLTLTNCVAMQHLGSRWFQHCDALTSIDFSGCSELQSVGHNWLSEGGVLRSVDYSGCSALQSVDYGWLAACYALTSVDFSGCTALEYVGDYWLLGCRALTCVDFSACVAMQSVGDAWMCGCCSLKCVEFSGCTALQSVGDYWLSDCDALASVDFSGCIGEKIYGSTRLAIGLLKCGSHPFLGSCPRWKDWDGRRPRCKWIRPRATGRGVIRSPEST